MDQKCVEFEPTYTFSAATKNGGVDFQTGTISDLPGLVGKGFNRVLNDADNTFVNVSEHKLWAEEGVVEYLTELTCDLKLFDNFRLYPQDLAKMEIYAKLNIPPEYLGPVTQEVADIYVTNNIMSIWQVPEEFTRKMDWDRVTGEIGITSMDILTSIPKRFRNVQVYVNALQNRAIKLSDIPWKFRNNFVWRAAAEVDYRVLHVIPPNRLTEKILHDALGAAPRGTCGLLKYIPEDKRSYAVFDKLCNICLCYSTDTDYVPPTLYETACRERKKQYGGCGKFYCSNALMCAFCAAGVEEHKLEPVR